MSSSHPRDGSALHASACERQRQSRTMRAKPTGEVPDVQISQLDAATELARSTTPWMDTTAGMAARPVLGAATYRLELLPQEQQLDSKAQGTQRRPRRHCCSDHR